MKKSMLVLIAGGTAVAYLYYQKKQAVKPGMPTSNPSAYQPAQPSQTYPVKPAVAPRVDNANQPWYNNSSAPMIQGVQSPGGLVGLAQQATAGASIVNSLSDVWGNMSDLFGSSASQDLSNPDRFASESTPIAQGDDQSNSIGSAYNDQFYQEYGI